MLKEALQLLFRRDLQKLKKEMETYQDEAAIWVVDKNIANSAGNLCLHLVGNLNTYIGVGLGGTDYKRERDLEFSLKNIPVQELVKKIDDTILVVEQGLDRLNDDLLQQDFPIVIWDKPTGMVYTLVHLTTHLNYHLGQINYHRRLLDHP
ncbi:MAG: DUF1572 family protein [Sediminibacterium sp.]|nr:DUF1572 family protein [Sediminibacterium sp.]